MHDLPSKRRDFLKSLTVGVACVAATLPAAALAAPAATTKATPLQVWSCGGLAEAMQPAHAAYTALFDTPIAYTGAFAAALGKSLLTGSGRTDVFGGRVLALAQNLRKSGKMLNFKPLCFTSYVVVTPKGNPGNIHELADLARPGTRVAMAREASPPGGQAVMGILKASELGPKILPNVVVDGSCVQRSVESVVKGDAHAMIVERRISCIDRYAPHLEVVEIPEKFFPAGPLTFTMGVMADAKDKEQAAAYVAWMTGPEGQAHFEKAGFIPVTSAKGQELIEKLGVKDVA